METGIFSILFEALALFTWKQGVMIAIGGLLIYLAIAKKYEPAILLPMGFGTLLVNIPLSSAIGPEADRSNYLLMPAVSANVSGQIGSVIAGGLILSLVPYFL